MQEKWAEESLTKFVKSWSLMQRCTLSNCSKSLCPFSMHTSHMLTAATTFTHADSCGQVQTWVRPDRTSGFHHPPETAVSSQNQTDLPVQGLSPTAMETSLLRPGSSGVHLLCIQKAWGRGGNGQQGDNKIRGTVGKSPKAREIHLVKSLTLSQCAPEKSYKSRSLLNSIFILFFWPCPAACRILVPQLEMELIPPAIDTQS